MERTEETENEGGWTEEEQGKAPGVAAADFVEGFEEERRVCGR